MNDAQSMSPLKTGLAVVWYSFWTGAPIKLALCLLFMAMGAHPWEMPGLGLLLLFSIPIDMWAIGLVSRTLFLEKFRVTPPEGIGIKLWLQITIVNAIALPLIYYIQSAVTDVAKSVAASIMETDLMKEMPVAERIGIELTAWGSVATVVLLVLLMIWLTLIGRIVLRQVATASATQESYQALITKWDLMRVPTDQTLMLTAVTAAGVVLTFAFWGAIPITTPHPHEDYQQSVVKTAEHFKPIESLKKDEKVLAHIDAQITALEARQAELDAEKKKTGKGASSKGKAPAATTKTDKP